MKKTSKSRGIGTSAAVIRESMKCPVCMEVLLSPIYQCERGHNICNVCVEEVHECPLCKGDYGDTRNYFAEDLVNSMTLSCKYTEYGCTINCLGSQLREHQENCEFQPYRCPELACQELIGQGEMAKHLERHGFKIMTGESHMATLDIQDKHFDTKTEYNPWRIQTFNREFYTVASRQRDKNWYFWAWTLALPKEAKKFSHEIILSSSEKQVLYRGCVHSLRTPPEDIIKEASALVLSDQLVKAMREDGKVKCKVRFIEGKNWDKVSRKEKKPFLQSKKEARKNIVKVKVKPKTTFSINSNSNFSQKLKSSVFSIPSMSRKISKLAPGGASSGSSITSKGLLPVKPKLTPPLKKPVVTDAEQTLVLKIRESLKCPGCNEPISPPILLCTVGHSVCDSCRLKYENNCPLCRCPITGTRNFFAEELLYKTVQKCRYHSSGCDVCLPTVQIRLHEDTCDFAPYECPFSTCRKLFEPKDLVDHMKTHDIPFAKDELNIAIPFPKSTTTPICAIPSVVLTEGLVFIPLVIRETSGIWSFWVASHESVKFVYELRIKKQSKMLAFQGRVMSLRLGPNQILLRGEGLLTTDKIIKTFKTKDKFDFSLKIASIKGFAKSGVSFLTPLCLDSELTDTKFMTKTELFANKRTSKTSKTAEAEEDDDDIFIPSRNNYDRLFVEEDDEDESDALSHGSGSTHSLKKFKSDLSLSSFEFKEKDSEDESCAGEKSDFMIDQKSESSVALSFCAVEFGDKANVDGDNIQAENLVKSRSRSLPKKTTKGEETSVELQSDQCPRPSDYDAKKVTSAKKSLLKLKDKTSQKAFHSIESTSLKKVEFNPTAQVFTTTSTKADSNDVNNNCILDEHPESSIGSLEASHSIVALNSISSPNISVVKANPVVPIFQSVEAGKLNSKLEVFTRSCMDLKNCGSRESMKNKIQQLSASILGAIREEDEDDGSAVTRNEDPQWHALALPPTTDDIDEMGLKLKPSELDSSKEINKFSQDLIDLRSDDNLTTTHQTSIGMGEFKGPIEVIIQANDKLTSISLSNIRKNLDSKVRVRASRSDGSLISDFDLQIPINETESMELVEERQTASQVGSSLTRMPKFQRTPLNHSKSLLNIALSESYETIADGFNSTFQAVKNIISGILLPTPFPVAEDGTSM